MTEDWVHVTVETRDDTEGAGVATVTIDRPRVRNAIPGHGWDELHGIFDQLARDERVRVVVLTGAGEDFCSGADVSGDGQDRSHPLQGMRSVGRCCETLFSMPKPTIARVDGVAAGAGLNMALACDFVLASDRSRFSEIFARRGLNLDFGGSFLLPRIVGMQKAKELVLLADVIDAARADELGLVNRVVPRDQLDGVVAEFVDKLVAGPPLALAMSKKLLNQAFTSTLSDALDAEGVGQAYQFTTADTVEAMHAFVEKRPPRFTGR